MAKSAKGGFDKFINKPVKGAKIKEAYRQEKKAAVKERREAIEKHFEEKRQQKQAAYEARQQQGIQNGKPAYTKKSGDKSEGPRAKSGGSKVGKSWDNPKKEKVQKPEDNRLTDIKSSEKGNRRPAPAAAKTNRTAAPEKRTNKTDFKKTQPAKSFYKSSINPTERKAAKPQPEQQAAKSVEKPVPPSEKYQRKAGANPAAKAPVSKNTEAKTTADETMPLNKFLAHAGICSRRDAADKVKEGKTTVNGQVITEPAFKVSDTDVVKYDGKKVQRSKNLVYILMNKPKDTITTAEDPQGRKTVMDIVRSATQERVYPVGRLDRNTSGVLLLTNDGDLAQQLSHPSFEVKKIYEVRLDKPLTKTDFDKILDGITLEDGKIHADSLAYTDSKDRTLVGIEIHSGRNRIVRRMFEHLGYDVRALDRVMYANLTKKNVDRGHWRFLTEKEVRLLKYFNKSKKGTVKA